MIVWPSPLCLYLTVLGGDLLMIMINAEIAARMAFDSFLLQAPFVFYFLD